jgi:protocadherin Fat 4
VRDAGSISLSLGTGRLFDNSHHFNANIKFTPLAKLPLASKLVSQPIWLLFQGSVSIFVLLEIGHYVQQHESDDVNAPTALMDSLLFCSAGTPPMTGTGTVRVIVQDMNDHSPEFERQSYSSEVAENAAPGTEVLRPSASDKDAGLNAFLR